MEFLSRLFAGVTVTVSLESVIAAVITFIGLIAWFIRLESKVTWLEKAEVDRKIETEKKDAERKAEIEKIEQAVWDKFESVQNGMNQRFETAQSTMNQVLISLGELKGLIGGKKDAR
ncbi:MAG: hypothetical protein ACKOX6_11355 [Bdellovibrio sp.]